MHELADTGNISVLSIPVLARAQAIYKQSKAQAAVKDLVGDPHDFNLWIHGPAGAGKTSYYRDYFATRGGIYNKDKSKYWNCYNGEQAVLIDDIELSDAGHMHGLLKKWCQ